MASKCRACLWVWHLFQHKKHACKKYTKFWLGADETVTRQKDSELTLMARCPSLECVQLWNKWCYVVFRTLRHLLEAQWFRGEWWVCSVTPVLYSKSRLFDGTKVIILLVRIINLSPGTGILIQSLILFWLGLVDFHSAFCFWSPSSGKISDIPHKYHVGPAFRVALHPWSRKHAVLHRWTLVYISYFFILKLFFP